MDRLADNANRRRGEQYTNRGHQDISPCWFRLNSRGTMSGRSGFDKPGIGSSGLGARLGLKTG